MSVSRRRLFRLAALAAPSVAVPGLAAGCRRGIVLDDISQLDQLEDRALAATLAAQATAEAERLGIGVATPVAAPRARDLGFDTDIGLTANDAFYIMKYGTIPQVDAASFRLAIGGEVARPVELALDDLRALPSATFMRTLECISNPAGGTLIGNAVWTGVAMADVLRLAGQPSAGELKLESADRYHTGVPLDLAMDARSYLVYEMNGAPLPAEHGFPVRCLFPGRYGQKQPKWLTRITVQRERHPGHWEAQGWSDTAEIRINSRFDAPRDHATVTAPVTVRGIAFSDPSGVAKVELVVDNKRTVAAVLRRAPGPDRDLVWTEWVWTWDDPAPGNHVLLARAADGSGRRQSRAREHVLGGTFPDGTTDMHKIGLFVPGG